MQQRPSVLILDKDSLTSALYQRELEAEFHVFACQTVDDARQYLKNKRIDVLVIEPMGLGTESWGLFDKIGEGRPLIIVCSTQDIRKMAFDKGAADYLLKPVTPAALLSAINKHF